METSGNDDSMGSGFKTKFDDRKVIGEFLLTTDGSDMGHEVVHIREVWGRGVIHEFDELAPGPHRTIRAFNFVGSIAEQEEPAESFDRNR